MRASIDQARSYTVLRQDLLSSKAMLLRIACPLNFLPGQVIGISDREERSPRWYSICNAPGQGWIEVLYTLVEEGELTPILFSLKPGDQLLVWPPRGAFGQSFPAERRVWWIANGTGIAPFASLFRAGQHQHRGLIHGARSREDAYFADEFRTQSDFFYVPCLSRPGGVWYPGAWEGRLLSWLHTRGPDHWQADDAFMLCGSDTMVVEARDILISQGINHADIAAEIYF